MEKVVQKCYTYEEGESMPTSKKRINLSVDNDLYEDLKSLKELRGESSLSSLVVQLTKEALEIQEDLYLAKIADERNTEETISHEKAWK